MDKINYTLEKHMEYHMSQANEAGWTLVALDHPKHNFWRWIINGFRFSKVTKDIVKELKTKYKTPTDARIDLGL